MTQATVNLSPEVMDVLQRSTYTEGVLYMPPGQLERSLYVKVDKAITLIGGKWNKKTKGHVFAGDAADQLAAMLDSGKVVDEKKLYQFYQTPHGIAQKLVKLADVRAGDRVLEPSAGDGRIVGAIRAGVRCDVCEIQQKLREQIASMFAGINVTIVGEDFLAYNPGAIYDRIIANPPFSNRQDIKHIRHMLELLKVGGRVVSVLFGSLYARDDRPAAELREELERNYEWHLEELPAGAFSESGTKVSTSILIADRC